MTPILAPEGLIDSPFPGLRPFSEKDSPNFFGRSEETYTLLQRLRSERFVAVLGPSGCGKSSLLQAGVIAMLRNGFMAGGRQWRIAAFRPRSRPLEEMVNAVRTLLREPVDREALLRRFRREGDALSSCIQQALEGSRDPVFLYVDQFEELFDGVRRAASRTALEDAKILVDHLLTASASSSAAIYICLTMRSEYLGSCSDYPRLADSVNQSLFLVPQVTRAQMREAIVEPIQHSGASISDALVDKLLNDAGSRPDGLPLLQHALMRLWLKEERGKEELTLDDYEREGESDLGRMLDRHVEETFREAPKNASITETILREITEVTPSGQKVRRPRTVADIAKRAKVEPNIILSVVAPFARADRSFLIVKGSPEDPASEVDLSHETLIRNWNRLSRWVDDEAFGTRLLRQFEDTAADYERLRNEGKGSEAIQLNYGLTRLLSIQRIVNTRQVALGRSALRFRRDSLLRTAAIWGASVLVFLVLLAATGTLLYQRNRDAKEHAQKLADANQKLVRTNTELEEWKSKAQTVLAQNQKDRQTSPEARAAGRAARSLRASTAAIQPVVLVFGREGSPQVADVVSRLGTLGLRVDLRASKLYFIPEAPFNAVWYGNGVSRQDIGAVALTLIGAGIAVRKIEPVADSKGKENQIQVGWSEASVNLPAMTVQQVEAFVRQR